MWRLIVWFLCIKTILSQPVLNENFRGARQLDFGECCPCNGFDRSVNDENIFTTTAASRYIDDDCPCRSQDSDTASSILRPSLRIADPFIRSQVEKQEPKPLLKPEVGLANSVLETLRDATDQEYQEALERDAARNAMDDMNKDLLQEVTPRNVVNIILKPKEQLDDAMPEASHVQETRCIHPPLGTVNRLGQARNQNKLFTNVFPHQSTNNGISNKKYLDMTNSASNLQEQVLPPLKTSILEDFKMKSDLLKMKLFPNLRQGLLSKDSRINPSIVIKKYDGSNREKTSEINAFTLIEPNLFHGDTKYFRKNLKDDISKTDEKSTAMNDPELEFLPLPEQKMEDSLLDRCITDNHNIDNDGQKDTNELSTEPRGIDVLDVVPSPSEINELKKNIGETENNMNVDSDSDDGLNKNYNNYENINGQSLLEDEIPQTDIITDSTNNFSFEDRSSCLPKDMYSSGSNDNIQDEVDISGLNTAPLTETTEPTTKQQQEISESILSTVTEYAHGVESDPSKMKKSLPNIKDDILKTLENFKAANEKIQEKLRLNVQNALQLGGMRTSTTKSDTASLNLVTTEKIDDSSINMDDLQKLSNNILNLSENSSRKPDTLAEANEGETNTKSMLESVTEIYEPAHDVSKSLFPNTVDLISQEVDSSSKTGDEFVDDKVDSKLRNNSFDDTESKDSGLLKTDMKSINDDNEMMSEASSPYSETLSPVNINPEDERKIVPNINVKDFFENLKSSVADIFNSNNNRLKEDIPNDNEFDNSNINSIFQQQPLIVNKKKLKSNEPMKSANNVLDLNSYKAKVAIPDSLNIKTLPNMNNKGHNYPQKLFKDHLKFEPTGNTLRNLLEMPTKLPLEPIRNRLNDLDPVFNARNSIFSQEIPSSGSLKTLSENFKSRAEDALKNIKDTFDATLKRPQLIGDNNIFSETFAKPTIFRTVSKTNDDLSKKLHAFNTDLLDRLTLMSQRTIPSRKLSIKAKNELNALSNKFKSKPKLNSDAKNADVFKTKPISPLKPKPYITQKSDYNSRRSGLDLSDNPLKLGKGLPLKKDIKLKPFKESKVSFSFTTTTTRPKGINFGSEVKKTKKPPTTNLRSSINLPKTLTPVKTPSQRLDELKARLKTMEPKHSASERYISKMVMPDKDFDKSLSLSEEDLATTPMKHVGAEGITSLGNLEMVNEHKLGLPKLKNIRNYINKDLFTKSSQDSLTDTTVAASDNDIRVATTTSIKKPLKQNVSYKCKMICVEDETDSK